MKKAIKTLKHFLETQNQRNDQGRVQYHVEYCYELEI